MDSSRLHAKKANWEGPMSSTDQLLAWLFDIALASNSDPEQGKPDFYPRPFNMEGRTKKKLLTAIQAKATNDFYASQLVPVEETPQEEPKE